MPGLNLLRRIVTPIVLAIARLGANPADSTEVRWQKAIQINTVVLGGIPVQASLGVLNMMFGDYTGAGMALGFATLSLTGLIFLALTRRHYAFFKFTQLAIAIVSPLAGTLVSGGIANVGFALMWGLVSPMLALVLYKPRQASYWFVAFLAAVFVAGFTQPYLNPVSHFPPQVLMLITINNIVGISFMAFAALYFFVNQRDLAYRLLNIEKEKAETLLLNILPKDIAAILKDHDEVIAEQFDGASILFADVVNFTPLTARMTAVDVVQLLNEVFSYFDALVEKHGLEKIKTIGDCYMVAAGVPRARSDHALALTRMALEMRDYVGGHTFRGRTLNFRIGINSGPVVAGVIGRKKFIYDLWGDAVNTASRMESHGQGNEIQITQATYDLIKDDFICEARGAIQVKGKGEMEVWRVLKGNLGFPLATRN